MFLSHLIRVSLDNHSLVDLVNVFLGELLLYLLMK